MKTTILIISLLLFFFLFSIAQEDIEEKILTIRNEFNHIESNLKICKKKQFNYIEKANDEEVKFDAFYLPYGRLVKLIAKVKNKVLDKQIDYYCKENAVFFIFIQEKKADGSQEQRRIYFDDNYKVIKDLYKVKLINDKRDFSKIENGNSKTNWPDLTEIFGQSFYGDRMFEKYFSYPIFENVQDNEMKIKKIKEEYDRIESLRNSGSLKEYTIDYTDSIAYWNNTRYTARYDDQDRLVLLTYAVGEEGYFSENQIYFKERKPFFAFTSSIEASDFRYETRNYIFNNLIVESLIKNKSYDDSRDFEEIPNEENNEYLENIMQFSKRLTNGIESEVLRFYKGFEANTDN